MAVNAQYRMWIWKSMDLIGGSRTQDKRNTCERELIKRQCSQRKDSETQQIAKFVGLSNPNLYGIVIKLGALVLYYYCYFWTKA